MWSVEVTSARLLTVWIERFMHDMRSLAAGRERTGTIVNVANLKAKLLRGKHLGELRGKWTQLLHDTGVSEL